MIFGKRKPTATSSQPTEDDIQEEIRKRILKASKRKAGKENAEEATRATLDAMEDMVSLTREEMEQIADEVRSVFRTKEKPSTPSRTHWLFPWTALILIAVTFFLVRRGSSWYLYTGLIVIFICLNHFLRKPPPD